MAYRCRNCGKFVAKNATTCKHCGLENPLIQNPTEQIDTNMESHKQVYCPNCGSILTVPKKFENERYLLCSICNHNFANPLSPSSNHRWIDGETMGCPNRALRNIGIIALSIAFFYLFATMGQEQTNTNVNQNIRYELVVVNGEAVEREALSVSDYDIIHKWQESNMGLNSQECRLERIKKDGSYRILIGDIYYFCEPKVIGNNSNIYFYNPNVSNGRYFNLENGTPIFFIPQMENDGIIQTDGILIVLADGNAQLYMNDNSNQHFEIFTELRLIY